MHMNRKGAFAALSASLSLAALGCMTSRFDGNDPALAEIQREIKGFGDDVKGLKGSMEKDLADLRKAVDETKGAIGPEVKAQIEALSASVATKHGALEDGVKKMQAQVDGLDVAFKRLPSAGTDKDAEAKARENAVRHFETQLALKGVLNPANREELLADGKIDIEGYNLWAKSFGMYLRANDDRALDQKALQVGSNPDGGYLVPSARSASIIQKIFETSPMRALAGIETIGTTELEIPVDIDEASAGWVGETQTRSETNTPQVGVQKIPVHELYAKPKATQKFLEDASINVEAWLADKVSDKFSRTEATAFVSGNGINKPRGFLTYSDGSGRGYITQYPSLAAAAITADAIVKMPFQIKQAYLAGASWMMKRSTVMEVMLLKDGQGQYLWRPSFTAGAPSILGGYNVNMADDMPAVQAGSLSIAFANWKRAYLIVDRLGITTLRDPYSVKPFVEFYSRKRVGGDVTDFDAIILMDTAAA